MKNRRETDSRFELILEHQKDIARIKIVLEGVPDYNANNEIIGYIGGMRNDLTELKHQGNGGGGFSLRRRDKLQIAGGMTSIIILLEAITHAL